MCCVHVEGVTDTTVDIISDDIMSAGVADEDRPWSQSSIEIHRAEFHDATAPDQHATGSALPVDASGPPAGDLSSSCNITQCRHESLPHHITA